MFSGQVEFEPADVAQQEPAQNEALFQPLSCQIGDRLYLRPLLLADTDALFALIEANRAYLRVWMPWLDITQTIKSARDFIQQRLEDTQLQRQLTSAICDDTQLIGLIDIHGISWENRLGAIGYWLAEPYQGKGIMTRACRSVLNDAFTRLNLNRIEISCATSNLRSQAIPKRLGLTDEGTFREVEWLYDRFIDHRVYAMLRTEWTTEKD